MPLPMYQSLENHYPHGDAEAAKMTIGGNVNLPWVTNTCVIRISRSLNYAGAPIPSNYPGLSTAKGGDGKRYAYRVAEFYKYMCQVYGQPDHTVDASGGAKGLAGKTGIIMFEVSIWSDATGHFDLWDGTECVHHCYWEEASRVHLWEC